MAHSNSSLQLRWWTLAAADISLKNIHYEADHPIQAIKAHDKALEFNENAPDVLADQGTMFRQVGWSKKAIDNFKKANKLGSMIRSSVNFLPQM